MFKVNGKLYTVEDVSNRVHVTQGNLRPHRFEEFFKEVANASKPILIIGDGFEPIDRKSVYRVYDYALKLNKFEKIAAFTCNLETDWGLKHFFDPMCLTPLEYGLQIVGKECHKKTKLFHFINRTPRVHRIKGYLEIKKRKLIDKGFISFTGGDDCAKENIDARKFIPDFPIVLDNKDLTPNYILKGKEFTSNPVYKIIQHAIVGLIGETNYHPSWHPKQFEDFFISEKTFSCFSMMQIPIVLGNPGTVKWLKEHKFYMFDSLIDNSYDSEKNPNKRLKLAIDELAKLENYDPQELFFKYKSELEYNKSNLEKVFTFYKLKKDREFNRWLKKKDYI